jgi:hypothetical protein
MGKAESSGKWSLPVRARALSPTRIYLPLAALIRPHGRCVSPCTSLGKICTQNVRNEAACAARC